MRAEERAEELFLAALEREPAEREAFLREACGGDEELRALTASLLEADREGERLFAAEPWRTLAEVAGPAAAAGRRVGDYRLVRELGRGGMGVVWEAEELSLGRRVALKLLPPGRLSGPALERLQGEARAGARLRHPGVVAVYRHGEHGGVPFIAQELVPGGRTLAARLESLRRRAELPPGHYRDTAALVARVAGALEAAHREGVVHCDVKPGNVLIAPDGRPKVADFGLARVEDALSLSRTGQFAGTPFYVAPEQVERRRGAIDRRTDVFALGVTLYEALTLARPFEGASTEEVLGRILFEEPADPRARRAGVPRDLAVICLKALEKRPERRFGSAAELAAELRRYLNREPILTRPPHPLAKLGKWALRHPGRSIGGALGGVVIIITVMFITEGLQRRRAESMARATSRAMELFVEGAPGGGGLSTGAGSVGDWLAWAREGRGEAASEEAVMRSTTLWAVGSQLHRSGRTGEGAEPLLRESLAGLRAALGNDHPAALGAQRDLAAVLAAGGDLDGAAALLEDALERWRGAAGELAPETLRTLHNLGVVHLNRSRLAEADAALSAALAGRRAALGENHALTHASRHALGLVRAAQDRPEEAEELVAAALEGRRRSLTALHPHVLQSLHDLGELYLQQGRPAEAEPLLASALEGRREALGPEHADTLRSFERLLAACGALGRADRVEELLHQELGRIRRRASESHAVLPGLLANLGVFALRAGRLGEAEEHLAESLEELERAAEPDPRRILTHLQNLFLVYRAQGREHAVEEALEGRVQRFPEVALFANELAWYWADPDRPHPGRGEEAAELARRAVAAATPAERPDFLDTLAWSLVLCGRHAEALQESERALAEAPPERRAAFASRLEHLRGQVEGR